MLRISLKAAGSTREGQDLSYWSLQLSPNSVSTVPFRGRHVSVWEHADSEGR